MGFAEMVVWSIGGLLVIGVLVALYLSMNYRQFTREWSNALPEREGAEQLAVSEPPKGAEQLVKNGDEPARPRKSAAAKKTTRKYTKRSKYWNTKTAKAKTAKTRRAAKR